MGQRCYKQWGWINGTSQTTSRPNNKFNNYRPCFNIIRTKRAGEVDNLAINKKLDKIIIDMAELTGWMERK